VDTASAMLEMDQILKANELSISLIAAVPAFLIAGGSLYYLGRWGGLGWGGVGVTG
jgi:nuclear-control-of-ATPase protein 2